LKEVSPEKGLQDSKESHESPYTDAEFEQAVSDGEARQAGEPVTSVTGFTPEQARTIDTITLLRIYDLLFAILSEQDEDMANAILAVHAEGGLVGPEPVLNF
jgi:hypothetical protein